MNVSLVADLVRGGHQFVGLSPESITKLAELRQFFTLLPLVDHNAVDPHTAKVSGDDDALISAIYDALTKNLRSHRQWDADHMTAVAVTRVAITQNNVGRAPAPRVRGEAHHEPEGAGSPRRLIAQSREGTDEAGPASPAAPREDATPGGMKLFDVPMNLSQVSAAHPGPGVALATAGLSDDCVHRCSVQVTALPPLNEQYQPACTFGITTTDVFDDIEASQWVGVTWRVGNSLPCALQLVATTANDQPVLRGADGHVFVEIGDVLTMETRPRQPIARAPVRKYEELYRQQREKIAETAPRGVEVDALFYINGRLVGTLQGIDGFQPVVTSNKYRHKPDDIADDKGLRRRADRGFAGCRFGVQLCAGAGAVIYDLCQK